MKQTLGIHHITAMASDPKRCVDFYTRVLGLRLVKKSVNQDQVEAYHLFFGDKTGEPGMDLTFFVFDSLSEGRRGTGEVALISLAVRESALDFWQDRFDQLGVETDERERRFDLSRLPFADPDGLALELVGVDETEYQAVVGEVWTTSEIDSSQAIAAFHGAKLTIEHRRSVESILTEGMGYVRVGSEDNLYLYTATGVERAACVELEVAPEMVDARQGAGSVHHIAFQVRDEQQLLEMRTRLRALGLYPTEVIDRYYFKSVYFQTPVGILFELATKGPGFTVDEAEGVLGQKLALPPFLESRRLEIEAGLVEVPEVQRGT